MTQAEERLGKEIRARLAAAKAADEAEEVACGPERTGDELPEDASGEIARPERRLATIRGAKEGRRAEAIRHAEEAERERRAEASEPKKPGKRPDPSESLQDAAQRHFTAPDSRLMQNALSAFVQASNAPAAVEASGHPIIVGWARPNQTADAPHREPRVEETTESKPTEWRSDAGYFRTDTVGVLEGQGSEAFIPPDRQRQSQQPLPWPVGVAVALEAAGLGPSGAVEIEPGEAQRTATAEVRAKLRTEAGRPLPSASRR